MTADLQPRTAIRVRCAIGDTIDRAFAELGQPPLGLLARQTLAEEVLDATLDMIDREEVSLVEWPDSERVDADYRALLVLPGGAVVDATARQVDEWTWIYVADVQGTNPVEVLDRIVYAPAWWPRWRSYRLNRRDSMSFILAPDAPHHLRLWVAIRGDVHFGRSWLTNRIREHAHGAVTDCRWIVAAVVYRAASIVGRVSVRAAFPIDRLAMSIEDGTEVLR